MSVAVQMMLNHAIGLGRSRRSSNPPVKTKSVEELRKEKEIREKEHARIAAFARDCPYPIGGGGEVSHGFD